MAGLASLRDAADYHSAVTRARACCGCARQARAVMSPGQAGLSRSWSASPSRRCSASRSRGSV